jgi:hypothetical protein
MSPNLSPPPDPESLRLVALVILHLHIRGIFCPVISFSSTNFPTPIIPYISYPKPTPTCGTHVFLFYPIGLTSLPFSLLFPSTHPRVQDRGLHAGAWIRRPRLSQRRTSPRRPANQRSAGPRRPSPALCGGGPRGRASSGSPSSPPPAPARRIERPRRREAPGRQIKGGPVDGGRKWLQGRRIEGPDLQPGATPPPHLRRTRGGPTQRRPVLLRLLSPFLQLRRRRAAISSSLLPRRYLSFVMARSNNRWTRWGPSEGVAHALECALFGACGMRTGHPVHRSARAVRREKRRRRTGARRPVPLPVPSATSLTRRVSLRCLFPNRLTRTSAR